MSPLGAAKEIKYKNEGGLPEAGQSHSGDPVKCDQTQ